jgi:hypothetical protein
MAAQVTQLSEEFRPSPFIQAFAQHIGDKPGLLYADGSFDVRGVPPGIQILFRIFGTLLMGTTVAVRDQDIDRITGRKCAKHLRSWRGSRDSGHDCGWRKPVG